MRVIKTTWSVSYTIIIIRAKPLRASCGFSNETTYSNAKLARHISFKSSHVDSSPVHEYVHFILHSSSVHEYMHFTFKFSAILCAHYSCTCGWMQRHIEIDTHVYCRGCYWCSDFLLLDIHAQGCNSWYFGDISKCKNVTHFGITLVTFPKRLNTLVPKKNKSFSREYKIIKTRLFTFWKNLTIDIILNTSGMVPHDTKGSVPYCCFHLMHCATSVEGASWPCGNEEVWVLSDVSLVITFN